MALMLYNSMSRMKEIFKPREEGYVGMYVCGQIGRGTRLNSSHL